MTTKALDSNVFGHVSQFHNIALVFHNLRNKKLSNLHELLFVLETEKSELFLQIQLEFSRKKTSFLTFLSRF